MRKSHTAALFHQRCGVEIVTGSLWTLIRVYFEREYSSVLPLVQLFERYQTHWPLFYNKN